MSKGRSEKAEKVLLRGARLNGRRKFSTHLVKESVSGKGEKKEEKEEGRDKQYSARDLFRGKKGRVHETRNHYGSHLSARGSLMIISVVLYAPHACISCWVSKHLDCCQELQGA